MSSGPTDTDRPPATLAPEPIGPRLPGMGNEELRTIIEACERAIADGSAGVEEFEAFVLAQRELARRTWS